jgi:hypothetical protein
VRKNCPAVPETPTPSRSRSVVESSIVGAIASRRRRSQAAATRLATPAKWATTARGSIPLSRCNPIMATAVETELSRATSTAKRSPPR